MLKNLQVNQRNYGNKQKGYKRKVLENKSKNSRKSPRKRSKRRTKINTL